MKKIIILITTILITFIAFIIISNNPRNYSTNYSIDNVKITEQFNKKNNTYLFVLQTEKNEIPYQIIHAYTKKRKLVKKINIKDNCITATIFEDNYSLCFQEDKIITSAEKSNEDDYKTEKNIDIYNFDEKIYLWNYKGYYKIQNNNITKIDLIKNDNYENKISASNNKYLITANYDEKYEFTNFYILNTKNDKIKELTTENPISSSSYFLGNHNNQIFLLDPKYKIEYKINPKKSEITTISKDGDAVFYDNAEIKISLNKLIKEKLVFTQENPYNYFLEKDNLYLKFNGETIRINTEDVKKIIKINNETIYYIANDTLYKYSFGKSPKKLLSNTEWNFISENQIFIFN